MALPIVGLITTAFSTIGTLASSWLDRKKIKAEGKVKVEVAKVEGAVERAQTITEGEVEYDKIAVSGMRYSLKDEWLLFLFSVPFIMCFIPQLQPYVKEGFKILKNSTPEWFRYCFIGMVVASFGLKTFWNKK